MEQFFIQEQDGQWTLIKGNVKVGWSRIGEGLSGDYNPEDPNDIELLRFGVAICHEGEWEPVEDSSYCTNIPANAPEETKKKALEIIMAKVHEPLTKGEPIKRICEQLSWIEPKWIGAKKPYTVRITAHAVMKGTAHVEAEDDKTAEKLALEEARSGNLTWDYDGIIDGTEEVTSTTREKE